MTPTGKTIQIFLPTGDPQGIRIAEVTTRIVQVIEVPRSLLPEFFRMPEVDHVAVYFLFGGRDDDEPRVYIGQTGDLRARLTEHNQTKDFWERAVILISRTQSLTQTHALFLEWRSLQATRDAGRYVDDNRNSGSRPHTPAPLEADCHEVFETGRTLLSTLGYPVFDAIAASDDPREVLEYFYCKGTGVDGKGLYTSEGFVVLKDSRGKRANVPSIIGTGEERFRQRLIDSGVMVVQGDTMVFTKDHLFGSPSMAALALRGSTSNGWKDWKNSDGVTLDALKRTPAEGTS